MTARTLQALADALLSERHLLEELHELVRRQRESLSRDDMAAVEDTLFGTHRVLHTMREAPRRRRSLNCLLGCPEGLSLSGMDEALGERMNDELRAARDGLNAAGQALAREVELNRAVLRAALAATDEYTRALHGAAAGGSCATLLDRTG